MRKKNVSKARRNDSRYYPIKQYMLNTVERVYHFKRLSRRDAQRLNIDKVDEGIDLIEMLEKWNIDIDHEHVSVQSSGECRRGIVYKHKRLMLKRFIVEQNKEE